MKFLLDYLLSTVYSEDKNRISASDNKPGGANFLRLTYKDFFQPDIEMDKKEASKQISEEAAKKLVRDAEKFMGWHKLYGQNVTVK